MDDDYEDIMLLDREVDTKRKGKVTINFCSQNVAWYNINWICESADSNMVLLVCRHDSNMVILRV